MSHFNVSLDDPARGPEFSVRVMSRLKNYGCQTMQDVKERLESGALAHIKGLGSKAINEIREMVEHYEQLDNPQRDLLKDDPVETQYRLEQYVGSAVAIMHDVQVSLIRVALRGRISRETRSQLSLKLRYAADQISKLPTYKIMGGI